MLGRLKWLNRIVDAEVKFTRIRRLTDYSPGSAHGDIDFKKPVKVFLNALNWRSEDHLLKSFELQLKFVHRYVDGLAGNENGIADVQIND